VGQVGGMEGVKDVYRNYFEELKGNITMENWT
jgi:hypothetical protein